MRQDVMKLQLNPLDLEVLLSLKLLARNDPQR